MNRPVNHIVYALLSMLMAMSMTACIHTYPTPEGGEDPTEITLELYLKFNFNWVNFDETIDSDPVLRSREDGLFGRQSRAESWPLRVIAIITDTYGKSRYRNLIFEPDELTDEGITISLADDLKANVYHVAVWADYVNKITHNPLGYDAEHLPYVTELIEHGKETASRLCLYGSEDIDLTSLAGSWNETREIEITLSPPVARFNLIADDYDEFLEYTEEARRHDEQYYVTVTYNSEIPLSFNLIEGVPMRPEEKCGFTVPLHIITVPGIQMSVASDWLFNPSYRIYHTLSLTVYNSAKVPVAHTGNITFPTEQGQVTTVRGKLLTNFITGGIRIDNIWEDEIIIELN